MRTCNCPQLSGARLTPLEIKGSVLADLGISSYLDPVLLSEEEGVEKPSLQIFLRACQRAGIERDEVLHVGDELEA